MRKAALGIILDDNRSKILLVKRRDVPVWVLPGGGIDPGESPEEAVRREIKEETGLEVEVVRKVAEYSPTNKLSAPTYVYECRQVGGKLISLGKETSGIGYFPCKALPPQTFIVHIDWLQDALENLPTPIYKPITRVTYRNLFFYALRHPWQVFRFGLTRLLGF